jgi:T5SS/PEP-CTERM-associated repeat protein
MYRSHSSCAAMALRSVRSILGDRHAVCVRETGTIPRAALLALVIPLFLLTPPTAAHAAITPNGDVSPDPTTTTWGTSTYGYIGNTASGTLTVDDGSGLFSKYGYIGYGSTTSGVVNISGANSKWTNGSDLYVGNSGSGTLSITGGGSVSNTVGYLGYDRASTGLAIVSGSNSKWSNSSDLYVGNSGSGTLSIANGGAVVSSGYRQYIGCNPGSTGLVSVSGPGSHWTAGSSSSCWVWVGNSGSGTLSITGGGTVSSGEAWIAYGTSSAGLAMVTGSASQWTAPFLHVGDYGSCGSGILSICSAGVVTTSSISIGSRSRLLIDIGRGSLLTIAGANVYNYGTICMCAGVDAAMGTYTPISSSKSWYTPGTCLAVGGTWGTSTRTFSISAGALTMSGSSATIDRAAIQRILVNDSQTGWQLGVSVLGTTTSSTASTMSMIASVLSGSTLTALQAQCHESVLSAWTISTTGYTVSDATPLYLSMEVGAGRSLDTLALWHYDGTSWTEFHAADLAYDGTYASFTVPGLSGYAVTLVPEPGTLALLIAATVGSAVCRRRRNGKPCLQPEK